MDEKSRVPGDDDKMKNKINSPVFSKTVDKVKKIHVRLMAIVSLSLHDMISIRDYLLHCKQAQCYTTIVFFR